MRIAFKTVQAKDVVKGDKLFYKIGRKMKLLTVINAFYSEHPCYKNMFIIECRFGFHVTLEDIARVRIFKKQ